MARLCSFNTDAWDPSHRFETSWLMSPWILCGQRALISLYAFTVQIYSIIHYCNAEACYQAGNNFSYFTVLTYWALAFYFFVAAIHTFTYAHSGEPLLARLARPLQALHSLYYTTIVVYPFIVTIVYWSILSEGSSFASPFQAWNNMSRHLLNSVFALSEIVIPRTSPPPASHVLWLVVILGLYLGVAYITRATKGFYVYSFLDPSTKPVLVAAYIFGIALAGIFLFGFAWGLIWSRKWLTERKWNRQGKFSKRRKFLRSRASEADMEAMDPEKQSAA